MKTIIPLGSALTLALAWTSASAEPAANPAARAHDAATPVEAPTSTLLDVELDPLAYAANGFSVHGGLRVDHFRFDVGAFGLELPDFILSSDAFTSSFAGFGVKVDYHLNKDVGGFFFGVAGSRAFNVITHKATSLSETQTFHEFSVRAGYEFDLDWGLYVAPWVSVGTTIGSNDVTIDGDTLEGQGPISVFPTLHLGYRL